MFGSKRWVLPCALLLGELLSVSASGDACSMLAVVNNFRQSKGLNTLQLESGLSSAADALSRCEAAEKQLSHNCGKSSLENRVKAATSYAFVTSMAENTAYLPGVDSNLIEVNQAFINSPEHLSNLLNPTVEYFGFSQQGDYFTQSFAAISGNSARVVSCSTPRSSGDRGNDFVLNQSKASVQAATPVVRIPNLQVISTHAEQTTTPCSGEEKGQATFAYSQPSAPSSSYTTTNPRVSRKKCYSL